MPLGVRSKLELPQSKHNSGYGFNSNKSSGGSNRPTTSILNRPLPDSHEQIADLRAFDTLCLGAFDVCMSTVVGQRCVFDDLVGNFSDITDYHLDHSPFPSWVCGAEFGLLGRRMVAPIRGHAFLITLAPILEDARDWFAVRHVVPMDTHEQEITVWHVFYRPMPVHSSAV